MSKKEGFVFVLDADNPKGAFVPKSKASVSVYDHGFLYGDGVFEGIRIYSKRIFRLKEHLDRLWDSAQSIELEIPLSRERLTEVMVELAKRNGLENGYYRPVVSRGKGDLGINPKKCIMPTVVVIADKIQLYPEEFYEKGLSVVVAKTRRTPSECVSPNLKVTNYVNNILAVLEGNKSGAQEVIMLDTRGFLSEASADNVFLVKDNVVLTPGRENILVGVTRLTVMEICRAQSIKVEERRLSLEDLFSADEVFLTGTGAEIVPVTRIDGKTVANGLPGPVTRRIREEFVKLTKNPEYGHAIG
ncbi:MAG TPA: branched-chain-amino-acid transaminase [archaeon]|nr:branched-chain-amino-acid transaminase [archaeon]